MLVEKFQGVVLLLSIVDRLRHTLVHCSDRAATLFLSLAQFTLLRDGRHCLLAEGAVHIRRVSGRGLLAFALA